MDRTQALSFDDVLLVPRFSEVFSRKDVDVSQELCGMKLSLPVISSNMDTVTGPAMANAMKAYGAVGALHRFMPIQDNIDDFLQASFTRNANDALPIVSLGMGKAELERAEALYAVGANVFLLDVAHGASMHVVQQVQELQRLLHHSAKIIVGNFATKETIEDFNYHLGGRVDAYKVGIGGGSACLTRVVTGAGLPTFESVLDCAHTGLPIIADGGIRNSGDFAKALAAGATAVMLGKMLAGTDESPGEMLWENLKGDICTKEVIWPHRVQNGVPFFDKNFIPTLPSFKKYRGSASTESYEVQGKVAPHRSHEGDSFLIPYVGSVENVLQQMEGGLRSALSYVGAHNLKEFREKAEFSFVTANGAAESKAHGRK